MSAEPNLAGAFDRLSEVANRIADDRNTYFKVARATLVPAREMLADHMTSDQHHPGYVLVPAAAFEKMRRAVDLAREAGL